MPGIWSSYFGDAPQILSPLWFEETFTVMLPSTLAYSSPSRTLSLIPAAPPTPAPAHEHLGTNLSSFSRFCTWSFKVCSKFSSTPVYVLILNSACFTLKCPHLQSSQDTNFELSMSLSLEADRARSDWGEVYISTTQVHMANDCLVQEGEGPALLPQTRTTLQYNLDVRAPLGIRLRLGPNPKSHTCLGFSAQLSCFLYTPFLVSPQYILLLNHLHFNPLPRVYFHNWPKGLYPLRLIRLTHPLNLYYKQIDL